MLIRCSEENHHPAEWTPGLRLSIRRTRKTQCDGHKSGGQNISVLFGFELPLTRRPWVTLFEPFQIKWEVHIFYKEVFLRSYHCVRLLFIASVCILHEQAYENITFRPCWELRKLWNMKVTVITSLIGALGTIFKALERRLGWLDIRVWFEIIHTTTFLRSAWILRRVLETWEDLLSLRLQLQTIS